MKFLIFCVLIIALGVRSEIPAQFPKCHNADSECLKNAANAIIPQYFGGLREVNLLPFDPLRIKTLELERNPASPVNINLKFKDAELLGLKNTKVISFSGLNADLSGRTVFEAIVPEIVLKGTYILDGRILLLPIVGEGPSEITLKNLKVKFSTDLKPVNKDGHIYGSLEHIKLELDTDFVHFQFDNLFNGDKTLGDNMNKVVNESWKEVFGELKPSLSKSFGLIVKQLISKFVETHPYAELFL